VAAFAPMDSIAALNSLKVKELQHICREHGLGCAGRKNELIDRLVAFRTSLSAEKSRTRASSGSNGAAASPAISRGAYAADDEPLASVPRRAGGGAAAALRGRVPRRVTSTVARSPASASSARAPAMARQESLVAAGIGAGDRAAGLPIAAGQGRPLKCTKCGARCDMSEQSYQVKSPGQFWCPACRFREMDPFHPVVETFGLLHSARPSASGKLDFVLDLPNLRQWRREGLNIHARMVNVGSCKLHHAWPLNLRFIANGAEAFMVEPPEEGHKRRDVPQDVSSAFRNGQNRVSLQISDEHPADYLLGLVLVAACTPEDLQAQPQLCTLKSARARVCDLLARKRSAGGKADDDTIVCLAPDTLKLRCPITMGRVELPVRGAECQHLQCFGLEAFLQINRQMRAFNNRWVCPVCTLVLRPPDLVVDQYVQDIISKVPEDVDEVIINADGSWGTPGPPVRGKPGHRLATPPSSRGPAHQVIGSPVSLAGTPQSVMQRAAASLSPMMAPLPPARSPAGIRPGLPATLTTPQAAPRAMRLASATPSSGRGPRRLRAGPAVSRAPLRSPHPQVPVIQASPMIARAGQPAAAHAVQGGMMAMGAALASSFGKTEWRNGLRGVACSPSLSKRPFGGREGGQVASQAALPGVPEMWDLASDDETVEPAPKRRR